jgi:hypothetical protein
MFSILTCAPEIQICIPNPEVTKSKLDSKYPERKHPGVALHASNRKVSDLSRDVGMRANYHAFDKGHDRPSQNRNSGLMVELWGVGGDRHAHSIDQTNLDGHVLLCPSYFYFGL